MRGGVIQRGNLQYVVLPGDNNAGRIDVLPGCIFIRRGVLACEPALDAVDGQAR